MNDDYAQARINKTPPPDARFRGHDRSAMTYFALETQQRASAGQHARTAKTGEECDVFGSKRIVLSCRRYAFTRQGAETSRNRYMRIGRVLDNGAQEDLSRLFRHNPGPEEAGRREAGRGRSDGSLLTAKIEALPIRK
jgi:hypothetical protein